MSLESDHERRVSGESAPLLLFVVNVDSFFLSHRLPLALAAREAGLRVAVVARDTGHSQRIKAEGLEFISFPFSRSGTSFRQELATLLALRRLYKRLRPALCHHVTIKPVLYGTLAAYSLGSIPTVNAISGLGFVFSEHDEARKLRGVAGILYRTAFHHKRM